LTSQVQGFSRTEASTLGSPSKCSIILLHAVHDCPGGRTADIARHVSFAQITCYQMYKKASDTDIQDTNTLCFCSVL